EDRDQVRQGPGGGRPGQRDRVAAVDQAAPVGAGGRVGVDGGQVQRGPDEFGGGGHRVAAFDHVGRAGGDVPEVGAAPADPVLEHRQPPAPGRLGPQAVEVDVGRDVVEGVGVAGLAVGVAQR